MGIANPARNHGNFAVRHLPCRTTDTVRFVILLTHTSRGLQIPFILATGLQIPFYLNHGIVNPAEPIYSKMPTSTGFF